MNTALIIAPQIPWPVRDGWSLRHYQLIRALSAQMTCDLIALCPDHTPHDVDLLASELHIRKVLTVPHENKNKMLCALLGLVTRRPLGKLLYSSTSLKTLVSEVSSQNAYETCLVLGDICMAQYGAFVPGVPQLIWDLCDDIARGYDRRAALAEASLKGVYYRVQKRIVDKYVRAVSKTFDCILVIHDKDGDAVRPDFAGQIAVVPNSYQVDRASAVIPKSAPTILFTGCMTYVPNRDAAAFFIKDVLPKVVDGCSEVVFHIVGSGSETLDVLARQNVFITGYVDNLGPYYASCDVFVCPLRIGTGVKNKLLDAMASGCAIVTTSVGAGGLPVRDGRDVLIADTAADLAAAIRLLLRDSNLRRFLGTNARTIVERDFSTETVAEHLQKILSKLRAESPPPTPPVVPGAFL